MSAYTEKLINALQGKTKSNGGLNLPKFKLELFQIQPNNI